ncbi:MAG TPA: molybdate ABC transporter substrate-binding protein, partial [Nitrospinaceae bacterium]|nr:molybdate ABC transporter substrate-binding protein [Nitrospinaceae bacterium]
EIMLQLGLWKKLQPFLVRGENIAQTLQFVATGNAELGFVAKSQVEDPRFQFKGSSWVVPANMHDPVNQQAILLKPGLDNSAAKQFLEYLRGPASKKIIRSYGYHFLEKK